MPDNESQSKSEATRRPRRWRRWVVLSVLFVIGLWIGRFAYLRITLRPTPRPEYWEAKLAALDPPPPGALSATRALTLLADQPWTDPQWGLPATQGFSAYHSMSHQLLVGEWLDSRSEVAAAIRFFESDDFTDAHAQIAEAARVGWADHWKRQIFRWPDDYVDWCAWLTVHSRYCVEHLHDTDAAIDDWLTCLRIARQRQRSRQAWDLNGAWRCIRLPTQEMMFQAGERALAIDSLDLATRAQHILGPMPSSGELLAGTRISLLETLEAIYVREGGNWLDVSAAVERTRARRGGGTGVFPSRLWNLTSPVFHSYEQASTSLQALFKAFGDADTLVAIQFTHPGTLGSSLGPLEGFTDYYGYGSTHYVTKYYEARTELEAALTLIALREYHQRHAGYPASLEDLVPDYLPSLPVDYADRQPLRYRRTNDEFVLYSIGADGNDDGGECEQLQRRWKGHNADEVFGFRQRIEARK